MDTSLSNTIYTLEESLLKPEVRQSSERLAELLSDDFIEITSSGTVADKKDVMENLPKLDIPSFIITDFKINDLSERVVLATYRISKTIKGVKAYSMRSSIWRKNGDRWQIVFHQGTRES